MVPVSVSLDVVDASPFTVELVSVTADRVRSNEIIVIDDTNFLLRAKSGRNAPRVYTITYEAIDDCGNVTEFSTTFTVLPRTTFRPR
jgi:hypothetical protein